MGVFVGADRHALVDDLVCRFEATADGDAGVQVVVLASPPGWGKTRVVQELYARLAASQPEPHYWPARIEPTDGPGMDALLNGRKRVYPETVVVPERAVMPWLWWGVRCVDDHGVFRQALFEDVTQVWAHAEGLVGVQGKVGRTFDATDAVVGLAGLLGMAVAPPVGIALAVTGAARTGWSNRDLVDRLRRWRERRRERTVDALAHGRGDLAAEIAEQLAQIARAAPVVLVIDDAHDADTTLVDALAHLLETFPTARVLVVATAWPQALDAEGVARPFSAWLAGEPRSRFHRIDLGPLGGQDMMALAAGDLDLILGSHGPVAGVAAPLVERSGGNPLGLRSLLRLGRVRKAIRADRLSEGDLASLPEDLEGVLADYFADLPEPVREVLARAASLGVTYVAPVVVTAAIADGIDTAAEAAEEARSPYGWVRTLDQSLDTFIDVFLADAARRGSQRLLTDQERDALHRHVVAAAIGAALDDDLSETARVTLWRQHVALSREGLVSADQAAADSASHLAQRSADRHAYGDAIDLARFALDSTRRAPDHPDTFATRHNLAAWYGLSGRTADATAVFESLLTDLSGALGPDHPDTLATRTNLAQSYGRAGRVDDAIAALEALLDDEVRGLGPDHPLTLGTHQNLAHFYGEAGRVDDAIAALETLLDDQVRVLGADHPDTLRTRRSLARWYGQAGRVDDAVTTSEALLDHEARVLGPDHPDTLAARNDLAHWSGEAGCVDDAVAAFETLLDDQVRVLGPDHPATLGSRHNVARWSIETGRVHDASAALEALVPDMVRVLGPEHPDTLATRGTLASSYGRAGRGDDAVAALETLLTDRLRVLGPDHPDTLTTRNNLAACYAIAGRAEDAVATFEALLPDMERVLGPHNPLTLRARFGLADSHGEAGRVEDAVAAFETLLNDQMGLLGPDHPDTLTTRGSLALWYGRAGRRPDAIAAFEALLNDQLRVLGPDHPHTLNTRHNVAQYRGEDGRVDDAVTAFEGLVSDVVRVLGADHPATLAARGSLARWYDEAGRTAEAIAACEDLLETCLLVLGPGHEFTRAVDAGLHDLRRVDRGAQ